MNQVIEQQRQVILQSELLDKVARLHKGRFAAIGYEVDAKCVKPKTNKLINPDGTCRVRKRCYVNIRVGLDYERTVNTHLKKEGKDGVETLNLPWGIWLLPNLVIKHKDNFYLRVYPAKALDIVYMLDGKEVDKSKVEHWLAPQKDNNRYGLDDKVVVRTIKFSNIQKLIADGETWYVTK
jgi:hypothetical protein